MFLIVARPHQHELETEQGGYAQGFRHRAVYYFCILVQMLQQYQTLVDHMTGHSSYLEEF
jgi:hypothetical protein